MIFKKLLFPFVGALATTVLFTAVAQAATINLNATEDTYLRGPANSTEKNYGLSGQLLVGSVGSTDAHMLLRFDLSGIPAADTINSVTLTTVSDGPDAGSGTLTVDIFELAAANADWFVGIGTGGGAAGDSGANWLFKDEDDANGGLFQTLWAGGENGAGVAGTDYINTNLGSFTADSAAIAGGDSMAFASTGDFATAVANNVGGFLNLIVLKDSTERDFFRVASNQNGNGHAGPVLTIDHSAIPEPSSLALLGVMGLGMIVKRSHR